MPIFNKLTRLAKPTARQARLAKPTARQARLAKPTARQARLAKPTARQEGKKLAKVTPNSEAGSQDPIAYKVMLKPHVTEKSMRLVNDNQYTFRVRRDVSSKEIKQAIEDIYKVNVVKVRIINVRKKEKRVGKTLGWKKGFKKAIVRIQAGQKIEFMPK